MREILALTLVLAAVTLTHAQCARVTARYINHFDPEGKRPVVMPDNLPVPPQVPMPAGPRQVSPGYPNDPQNISYYHRYIEPDGRRIVQFAFAGVHPGDTVPGFMDWKIWYRVSTDGGKTAGELKPIIQTGDEYNLLHPITPVYVGKNSFCPSTAPPVRASNGEVMLPFYFPPLDDAGNYYNPANAFTFSDGGVMIGWWNEAGTDLTWELGETVRLEPDQSTRGVDEPAVIELTEPGRFLMVIRASNSGRESTLPGYKLICISDDYCRTWSDPEPMRYTDGEAFYSPAACSELLRSVKTGKLYWIGNVSRTPPQGNSPRYPLVIGEIDEATCRLVRESVVSIDDLNPEFDSPQMQLSNFSTVQNPQTGQIVVTLKRIDPGRRDPKTNAYEEWRYPPCAYVIEVQ